MTANISELVTEHQTIKAAYEADQKRFSDHWKVARERMEQIQSAITAEMTAQGVKSVKTDTGTAILSEITTPKIKADERDAYIDWCMDNWTEYGGELMQLGAPKADAVRAYMDAHEGMPPPHVEIDRILRFSIRKA